MEEKWWIPISTETESVYILLYGTGWHLWLHTAASKLQRQLILPNSYNCPFTKVVKIPIKFRESASCPRSPLQSTRFWQSRIPPFTTFSPTFAHNFFSYPADRQIDKGKNITFLAGVIICAVLEKAGTRPCEGHLQTPASWQSTGNV